MGVVVVEVVVLLVGGVFVAVVEVGGVLVAVVVFVEEEAEDEVVFVEQVA